MVTTVLEDDPPFVPDEAGKHDGVSFYNLGVYVFSLNWIIVLSQPGREIFTCLYRNSYLAALMILGLCGIAIGGKVISFPEFEIRLPLD